MARGVRGVGAGQPPRTVLFQTLVQPERAGHDGRAARVRRGRLVGHEQHRQVRPARHVPVPEHHVQLVLDHGEPHLISAVHHEHDGVALAVHRLPHAPIPVTARHVGCGELHVVDCTHKYCSIALDNDSIRQTVDCIQSDYKRIPCTTFLDLETSQNR